MNLVLPRVGEVWRCGMITKYDKIPFTRLLGTLLILSLIHISLVLVDGIPMDMNQLDPNTIESVTVLKDAAAAAIYGARAANCLLYTSRCV